MKFLILILFSLTLQAAQVSLVWEPSKDEVAGYKIHYGTESGNYKTVVDVGNVTNYTVSELELDVEYFFAATAYNKAGLESDFSNEARGVAQEKGDDVPIDTPPTIPEPEKVLEIKPDGKLTFKEGTNAVYLLNEKGEWVLQTTTTNKELQVELEQFKPTEIKVNDTVITNEVFRRLLTR